MATFVPINDIRPYNSYVAAANQTIFVFDWFVQKEEYVIIYKNDVKLSYISDYIFTPNSIGNATGGSVQLSLPCAVGDIIVILRDSAIKRVTGYSESGEFRASTINLELNYFLTLLQELSFKLGRCIILAETDTSLGTLFLPKLSDRIGKYLGFDNNGNLVAVGASNIDLYYNWIRVEQSQTMPTTAKKVYALISENITLKLPIVGALDDGREILIVNPDSNNFNVIVDSNSQTITIDTAVQVTLPPGTYKKFVYNHSLEKWFLID